MSNMLLKYVSVFVILTVVKFAGIQSQEFLFDPQQSLSYPGSSSAQNSGTSTGPQFAPINSGASTDQQPAPISSGIPFNYQSVPLNGGTLTTSQASSMNSGNSLTSKLPPLSGVSSMGSQLAPVDLINLQPAPISSGTSTDFEQPPINSDPATNPNIELFAHSLYQLLQSTDTFGNHGTFEVYEPYSLMFEVGYAILIRKGITDSTLADLVAQAMEDAALLSGDLYYNAMSHMMAKFLDATGVLDQDAVVNGPQKVMSFVENYAKEYGVYDTKSVMFAVSNGFYDTAASFGLITDETLSKAFVLFAEYVKELTGDSQV